MVVRPVVSRSELPTDWSSTRLNPVMPSPADADGLINRQGIALLIAGWPVDHRVLAA